MQLDTGHGGVGEDMGKNTTEKKPNEQREIRGSGVQGEAQPEKWVLSRVEYNSYL